MAHMFSGAPKQIPEFTGLQVNTAVQVLPIPLAYGAPRINLNLIYYNEFQSKQQSAGGKGIGGGKGGQQTVYSATLLMSLGEGVIPFSFIIYEDQGVYALHVPGAPGFPSNGTFLFTGTQTIPWGHITALFPQDARTYKDTAYYAFLNADLGSNATVPQINVVPCGLLCGTCPLNDGEILITSGQYDPNGHLISFLGGIPFGTVDADPGQVILDFLTNSVYGTPFPANLVDQMTLLSSPEAYDPATGDQAISTYCQAVGIGWSVVINNAESANSILDRWTKNMAVAPVWNGEVLRFIPYWDRPANANPGWVPQAVEVGNPNGVNPFNVPKKYFTPYSQAITRITIDQILQPENKDDDPITFARKDPMTVFNTIRVDYRDRTNFFNDNVVEAKDEANIELYGPLIDEIQLTNEITLAAYANVCAQVLLKRSIAIKRTFQWRLSPLWGWLDPMDLVQIPDPTNYSTFITVRITSVETDEDDVVTVSAEEFPLGAMSPTFIPTSTTTPPNQGVTNIPAASTTRPVIFEPTTAMLTATGMSTPQVIIGASGLTPGGLATGPTDPLWGGFQVWVALTNDGDYEQIGTLRGTSTIGWLQAGLPTYGGSNPDTGDTLVVNLEMSDTILNSTDPIAVAGGKSLCVLVDASGFELLSYQNAVQTGTNIFSLTTLYRGLYGTTPREFGAGSQFLYIGTDANFFETALPPQYVGKTFFVKLPSINAFNQAPQALSDVVAFEYVAIGPTPHAPVAPPIDLPFGQRGPQAASALLASPKRSFTTPP